MSEHEFDQFRQGELLENDTDHRKNGEHTDSVGFCFFLEEPDDAIRWLSGIVTDDVCATFDVPDHLVTKSRGTYCDPDKSDNSLGAALADIFSAMMGEEMENAVTMEKAEYCCTEYSAKDFKLLRFEYSKRIKEQRRQIAEWDRTEEELPEGVLVQGTVTRLCNNYAVRKIAKALSQTIWKDHSHMTSEFDYGGYVSLFLPDGRLVLDGDSVEVHQDGVILVNGKLTGDYFPQLTINSGCFPGDTHYGLLRFDGESVEIPKDLYMKYEEAMDNNRQKQKSNMEQLKVYAATLEEKAEAQIREMIQSEAYGDLLDENRRLTEPTDEQESLYLLQQKLDDALAENRKLHERLTGVTATTGAYMIAVERERQVKDEGYNAEHDQVHEPMTLARAAVSYILCNDEKKRKIAKTTYWPWEDKYYKPRDMKRNLIRAGALVAAAIDRLLAEDDKCPDEVYPER